MSIDAVNDAFIDAKKAKKYDEAMVQAKIYRIEYFKSNGKVDLLEKQGKEKDVKIENLSGGFSGLFWFCVGVLTTSAVTGGVIITYFGLKN